MQKLSKTKGPQEIPLCQKGAAGKVLAKASANASLEPKEASFPASVLQRAGLADQQIGV